MLLNVLPIYHSIPVEIGTKPQTFHYSKSVLLKNAMSGNDELIRLIQHPHDNRFYYQD